VYYDYDSDNQLGLVRDEIQNTRTRYTYDLAGRLITEEVRQNSAKDNGDLIRSTVFAYEDGTNRLISRKDVFAAMPVSTGYVYGNTANGEMADSIYGVTLNGYNQIAYTYDSLGRKSSRTLNASGSRNVVTEYSYLQGTDSGKTTTLLDTVTQDGVVTQYAYDEMGSITQISEDGVVKRSYTYDALNQLTSETRDGITETYAYDNGGNILSRTRGGVTDTWSYESTLWKDLLTSYNGQAITYDEIGNPLTYRDGMTMTWQNGRRLSTLTKGSDSISYTYNADGIRTSKTVNGQTTEYILDGSTILGEKLPDGEYLYYLFDENGVRYGFARGSLLYYYVCNAQGDVIKILTSGGATAAWYEYDAWGNVVSVGGNASIANLNPIRYRGYYYDAETGFYYLNSRYYDPEICRFVNVDGYVSTGQGLLGHNMFAYCLNNPISNVDSSGSIPMRVKLYSDCGISTSVSSSTTNSLSVIGSSQEHSNDYVNPKKIPNPKSGYVPPKKNPNPQKVKNPNGPGRGWPANDGGVWVPDNNMDGGPGWVVQYPGGGHEHHYPDGKVRTHNETNNALLRGLLGGGIMIGSGVAIIIIAVDDLTGIGIADDFALPPLLAIFSEGVGIIG